MTAGPEVRVSEAMRAVLARLRRDGDRVFGARHVDVVPLTFSVRESSEVARVRVSTSRGVRFVYAKVFKPRPGEVGLAETQARFSRDTDITRRVCEAMAPLPELKAVEPIACYDDLLGMVTNEIRGRPLSQMVASDAAWPTDTARVDALERAVSRVGRWIAVFQQIAGGSPHDVLSLDAAREYIDVRLVKLTSLPRGGFGEEDRREILAHVERKAAEVPAAHLTAVPAHGDIVPSNVIAAPECVTVLDFGMTTRASRYLDIARLYTQLEFFTAKPQYRRGVIERLQRAALEAFEPGLRPDAPLFELAIIQHVVCHYLSHARQPGPFPVSVYSGHQCRRHRRWLRNLARRPAARARRPLAGV